MWDESAELRKKLSNAVRKGKAIQATLQSKEEEMKAQKLKIAELEKALDQAGTASLPPLHERLAESRAESAALAQRVSQLEADLLRQKAAHEQEPEQRRQSAGPTEVQDQLRRLNDDLRHQLQDAQARVHAVEEQLPGAQGSSGGREAPDAEGTAAMKETLDEAGRVIKALQHKKQGAVARADLMEAQAARLQQALAEAEQQAAAVDEDAKQQAGAARRHAEEAEAKSSALLAKLQSTEDRAARLEAHLLADPAAAGPGPEAAQQAAAAAADRAAAAAAAAAQAAEQGAAQRERDAQRRVAAAEERAAAAEGEAARLRLEDEGRRQKFSVMSSTFAKKEGALREALEVAEAQAAAATSEAADLTAEQGQLRAAVEAARGEAEAAVRRAEGAAAAVVEELKRDLAQAQEASRLSKADAAHANEALQRVVGQAGRYEELEAAAEAAAREAAQLRVQLEQSEADEAAGNEASAAAQEELQRSQTAQRRLAAEVEALRQQLAAAKVPAVNGHAESASAAAALGLVSGDGGGDAVPRREVQRLREQAATADERVAAAAAAQSARVEALEKQNRELGWQVAMLTRGGGGAGHLPVSTNSGPPESVSVPMPATDDPGRGTIPGAVGLFLRHRKRLLVAYVVLLHALVYIASTRSAQPAGAAVGA